MIHKGDYMGTALEIKPEASYLGLSNKNSRLSVKEGQDTLFLLFHTLAAFDLNGSLDLLFQSIPLRVEMHPADSRVRFLGQLDDKLCPLCQGATPFLPLLVQPEGRHIEQEPGRRGAGRYGVVPALQWRQHKGAIVERSKIRGLATGSGP